MPKFRKRPLVIEAEQYVGTSVKGMCQSVTCYLADIPHVHTMHNHQPVKLQIGDYVIPEPDGIHFYPCKPEVFEATYEPVEE